MVIIKGLKSLSAAKTNLKRQMRKNEFSVLNHELWFKSCLPSNQLQDYIEISGLQLTKK